jgi:hypothetical protein
MRVRYSAWLSVEVALPLLSILREPDMTQG